MSTPLPIVDAWLPLERQESNLECSVELGESAREAAAEFDLSTSGHSTFTPWRRPELPESWNIGVIVGASGTGKSTLLAEFRSHEIKHEWRRDVAIADHFTTAEEARRKFYAVGLSSVPTWVKPYNVLSNGERFRADLARSIYDGAVVDEFTSVVDRNVAQASSKTVARFIRDNNIQRVVFATVHKDILPYLQPDFVIDLDAAAYALYPRGCLQREPLVVDIYEVDRTMWNHFSRHHYLTSNLHPFARCYIATLRGTPVAFAAAIPFPHGKIRGAWREHRVVTLPDYQGLGIGPRLSDWVAESHHRAGYKYYGKTTHPRLGEYRDNSPYWTPTSHSRRRKPGRHDAPVSFGTRKVNAWVGSSRSSFSHRYTGGFGGTPR